HQPAATPRWDRDAGRWDIAQGWDMVVSGLELLGLIENEPYVPDQLQSEDPQGGSGPGSGTAQRTIPDCRRSGEGWVDYQPRDTAHGGRAVGVQACLDDTYLNTHEGSPAGRRKPPGYYWAQNEARSNNLVPQQSINNCHLLGDQLSGSGKNLDNLATCSRQANAAVRGDGRIGDYMASIETRVRSAVESGQIVQYTVTPQYLGPRTVPVSFEISALGSWPGGAPGVRIHEAVPNSIYYPGVGWRNLGLRDVNGSPVPVGAMR
ncbi:DNA/RNA non-specific endonuclease, partial [Streptomyces hainanensis]